MLLGFVLALSSAQGCAVLLSLDDFDESSDAGTSADSGQDADDANEAGSCSLTIAPMSHNFGPVPVGETSPPVQFKVLNENAYSVGPLKLAGPLTPTPNFVIVAQDCEGRTLGPSEFCTVDFVFQPKSPGVNQTTVLVIKLADLVCAVASLEAGAPPS